MVSRQHQYQFQIYKVPTLDEIINELCEARDKVGGNFKCRITSYGESNMISVLISGPDTMGKGVTRERACVECGEKYTPPYRAGGIPVTCSPDCRRKHRNKIIKTWRDARECAPSKHGTLTGFINHKCNCLECRKAGSEYRKKKRLEKKYSDSAPADLGRWD